MKIILKEDMPNLGFKGEIVDVRLDMVETF